ncbi:MAG: class I SAM-dependent methyltransferase [Myxococcales bacterium]|nr:class I SAM-dependent methyltransferase [Myxococcales bacterium]
MNALVLLLSAGAAIIGFQEFEAAMLARGLGLGGPADRFEDVGRNTLATSIKYGLMPSDKVLDVGAGGLRNGWWLIQFIEPSNYHAIEPRKKSIDNAAELIGAKINIYYNDDWEFPDVKFDFVLARSIWTHASKWMISKMLAEFAENSTPDARFLTSVVFPRADKPDYMGERWLGRPLVAHSLKWIEDECRKHALSVQVKEELYGQIWLLIEKNPG